MSNMITKIGNIVDVSSGHIIHGCNARGKMNSGVAKCLREKFPQIYENYKSVENDYGLNLGIAIPVIIKSDLVVWNLITQENFGYDGNQYVSYSAIAESMERMKIYMERNPMMFMDVPDIVHTPKLGAGRGGGDWNIIRPILEDGYSDFDKLILWEYQE